jgi:hypothetical protein
MENKMSNPTYWACTDCIENCMLIRRSDAVDPYACTEDNEDVSWKNITRDEFLRRDNLLNDPSHIVQSADKAPGLWRQKEGEVHHEVQERLDMPLGKSIQIGVALATSEVEEHTPKFKVGDRVVITDRILYWIEKFDWTEYMKRHISQIVTLERRARFHGYEEATGCFCWVAAEARYFWPEDCLKKV